MCWKWLNKENKVLDSLASIATILAVIFAVWIGVRQNQINDELKNIASSELLSSKSPLLSVDISSLKYDETPEFFTKEVKFSNKGLVPINVLSYEISFPENPKNAQPLKQVLDGTLFQGESIMRKTVQNKFALNEPYQLVVIKAVFVSFFDSKKEYCVTRSYTYETKKMLLDPMNFSEIYKCDQTPPMEYRILNLPALDVSM